MNYNALFSVITCPLSWLYGMAVGVRSFMFDRGWLHSKTYDLPIICVGNLAVGGTGKTPHVEYILRLLHQEGYHVAMLSRGYGRKTKGYILANHAHHSAAEIGDEPFQMMHNCPFATIAVCEKRVLGIDRLLHEHPETDVIVLDDAYQHRYVKAGLNVLLTDAHRLYTRDHLLPWGRLREPSSGARRANVVVVTKCLEDEKPSLPTLESQSLFYSRIVYAMPEKRDGKQLETSTYAGQRILLIAGIANPKPLEVFLRKQGADVVLAYFPDHHAFRPSDAARINSLWKTHGCTMAVTTQKDNTRIGGIFPHLAEGIKENFLVQPITVELTDRNDNQQSFNQIILHYVGTNKRNCKVD